MSNLEPFDNLEQRFCYLLSLQSYPPDSLQHQIYDWAVKQFNAAKNNFLVESNDDNRINSAIAFLNKIAENERQKEMKIINTYIQQLKKNSKLLKILKNNDSSLDDLIEELQKFSFSDPDNPPPTEDIKNYYTKLTILINNTRNTLARFKKRVEELNSDQSEISIFLRLREDLQSLLFEEQQEQDETPSSDIFIQVIRQHIQEYVQKNLTNNQNFLYDPIGTIAGIMIDFYDYISPYYTSILKLKTNDEKKKEISKRWTQYISAKNRLLRQLRTREDVMKKELDSIRNTIITTNEVKAGDKSQKTIKDLINILSQPEINRQSRERAKSNSSQTPEITWKFSQTSNLSSFIYEIIEALRKQGYKIKGSAATDVLIIDLGSIRMTPHRSNATDKIAEQLQTIGNIQNQRKNRFGTIQNKKIVELTELYKQGNIALQEQIGELYDALGGINLEKDIFIYHETLKLYAEIENKTETKFHGRKIAIYNALDSLYAASEYIPLANKNLLYSIVNNLSPQAIGNDLVEPVEKYLSIFAGLLMFDDIYNIAEEAASSAAQITTPGVQNIHLYLLNDVYVPGSYILTRIAQALNKGYQNFSSKDQIAYASIKTPNLDNKTQNINNNITQRWNDLAEFSAQNTKIQITFLTAFFDFINEINNYMG